MCAYYEHWHILTVLYFEMRQLPWFKVKWKKTLTNLELFFVTNIGETELPSHL